MKPIANSRAFAPELDVLRGIAAVLMIANHAGFRLLSAGDSTSSSSGAVVFLGGFAPVIFFFATGFGIALTSRPTGAARPLGPVLWKAALLVVADQFFYWPHGIACGLDFFSFIAISSVVVSLVARLRRPVLACLVLIVVLLALRYGLGPIWQAPAREPMLLQWVLGAHAVAGVSYPLSPWVVYPLLGFVLGRLYDGFDMSSGRIRSACLLLGSAAALVLLGMSLLLAVFSSSAFFRWGVVSAAYFLLSLGVLSVAGLVAMQLTYRLPRVASALALRGVASFAVSPIHYALLHLCAAVLPPPLERWTFALLLIAIWPISFAAASRFAAWANADLLARHRRVLVPGLLFSVAVLGYATLRLAAVEGMLAPLLVLVAQLMVAGLLGMRNPAPVRVIPTQVMASRRE